MTKTKKGKNRNSAAKDRLQKTPDAGKNKEILRPMRTRSRSDPKELVAMASPKQTKRKNIKE